MFELRGKRSRSCRPFPADQLQAQAFQSVLFQVATRHRGETLKAALQADPPHQFEVHYERLDTGPHPTASDVFGPPATKFDHLQLAIEVMQPDRFRSVLAR